MRYVILMLFLVGCGQSEFATSTVTQVIEEGVTLTSVLVKPGECTQVGEELWAENIRGGELFDVYYNDQCKDNLGEHCDNVIPSYGRSGELNSDEHPGSGTVCWVDNIMISGYKDNSDIVVQVLEFQ